MDHAPAPRNPGLRPASLGMYDLPWLGGANDRLWSAIAVRLAAAGLSGVPAVLERRRPLAALWQDPALLLAQTCGYPLTHALKGAVRLVATPCYGFPGCAGAWHRSVILLRAGHPAASLAEARGARLAINSRESNTGMNLLRAAIAPLAGGGKFFSAVCLTGGHLASIGALAAGEADVAAIDCVTYGLVARDRPALLAGTRLLGQSSATPGLPLITSHSCSMAELGLLRSALAGIAADPALAETRAALGMVGISVLPLSAYRAVAALERKARASDYSVLA